MPTASIMIVRNLAEQSHTMICRARQKQRHHQDWLGWPKPTQSQSNEKHWHHLGPEPISHGSDRLRRLGQTYWHHIGTSHNKIQSPHKAHSSHLGKVSGHTDLKLTCQTLYIWNQARTEAQFLTTSQSSAMANLSKLLGQSRTSP